MEKIGCVSLNFDYYDDKYVYNEGDDEEQLVLDTFKNNIDPIEVLKNDNRWPILYQLSEARKTIVEPMNIKNTDRVLEVGAGMGAVTGAVAQRCKKVDCIELSKRRSLANAYRNQKYDNIEIFVGNYNDIPIKEDYYDVVLLIGVLEYANSYTNTKNPYIDFLNGICSKLKKGGKIYIAIENRLGLKYFAGACEDHLGRPFVGIEGYSKKDFVKTFSKSQLEDLLKETGFGELYFYYPYPDYKLPTCIYSDDMLMDSTYSPDTTSYDLDKINIFDERKFYQTMTKTEELKVFSNSFLVEGVKE